MIKRYLFFSQLSCTKCPGVREFLKTANFPGDEIDTTDDAGFEEARKFKVMATPTIILYDENEKELSRAVGLEELKEAIAKNQK
jgi:ribonucleoside-triphosphate reductase